MFSLKSTHHTGARRGVLSTAHGKVETPMFMPIATKAALKTVAADELYTMEKKVEEDGSPILLSNTYHLYLKPGLDILSQFEGLHGFMRWDDVILTDSGGFQIFSLAKLRKITDQGVEFSSHIDGSKHFFTPQRSMEIQSVIGADIWMAFDYFPGYPATREQVERSVSLTTTWAQECKKWFDDFQHGGQQDKHQLFGIVQGSVFEDLRIQSATEITELDFDGYAIGGLAVGEPPEEMYRVVEMTTPHLPEGSVRYLMGVGPPEQIVEAVKRGVDLFDCVIPTRNARHGSLFIRDPKHGGEIVDADLTTARYKKMNIKAEKVSTDQSVIDPYCGCETCTQGYSRAYIRHLFSVDEPLGARLATQHNVYFYMDLMKQIRNQIAPAD